METEKNLFVYGTLMYPEVVRAVTGETFPMEDARLDGWRRHALRKREYPGVVPHGGASVAGKVLTGVHRRAMVLLNAFEGTEYERRNVAVARAQRGVRDAVAYVWAGGAHELLGDWDPIRFERERLGDFVTRIEKEMLEGGQALCGTRPETGVHRR